MISDLHALKYAQILTQNLQLGRRFTEPPTGLALLSNITAAPLTAILEFTLRRQGINARLQNGDYDNILQDAARFPEARVLIVFWELANIIDGLHHTIERMDADRRVELTQKITAELQFFFETVKGRSQVIFNSFSSTAFTHRLPQTGALETLAADLNAFVRANAPANTVVVDIDKIIARLSVQRSVDIRYFYSSKALYTVDFYKDYSQTVAPFILAPFGKTKKAVILDCDNTLWKGIIGEDGQQGIDMSPESAEGKIYYEVQSLMLRLQRQGILLGLCSKNNAEDVDRVLQQHPDMLIRDEHLSIKKVNWEDKASNLRTIAAELNIGIDSLVFLDDSDFEVNLVREQLPEVTVMQVPDVLPEYPDAVRRLIPLFVSLNASQEDQRRSAMYSEEKERQQRRATFADMNEYLKSLELKLTVHADSREYLPRIAQLTQKTNQFNLTTKRYTETDIENFMDSDRARVYVFRLEDKFGDYGLTGVAIVTTGEDPADGLVDTYLMSCRVIGRRVEEAFFETILGDLRRRGIQILTANYRQTPKNAQVADFWDRLGFTPQAGNSEDEKSYRIALADYRAHDLAAFEITFPDVTAPGQ